MSVELYSERLKESGQLRRSWRQPDVFDLSIDSDRELLERRMDTQNIQAVIDPIEDIADDLYELRMPSERSNDVFRGLFKQAVIEKGDSYGSWVHFPWNGNLVRYPEKRDHQELRTYRNQHLIREDEQRHLLQSAAAVFGMSVGSSIVDQLVQGGIGGKLIIGDYDTLSPSNLNRVRSSLAMVGARKLDVVGMRVSEVDPFVKQVHMSDGINEQSLNTLIEHAPDIIFDEIDNLSVKALLRQIASETKTPLVMVTDVADRSIVDVERYDIKETKPFNGRLSYVEYSSLLDGTASMDDQRRMQVKLVGIQNASSRLLQSMVDIDTNLAGIPQLGTTAVLGGALGAITAREILLDKKLSSGRYVFSAKKLLHLRSSETLSSTIRAFRELTAKKSH